MRSREGTPESDHEYDDIINDNVKIQKNPAYKHREKYKHKDNRDSIILSGDQIKSLENVLHRISVALYYINDISHKHKGDKNLHTIRTEILAVRDIIKGLDPSLSHKQSHSHHRSKSGTELLNIHENHIISCEEYLKDILLKINEFPHHIEALKRIFSEISACKHIVDHILKMHRERH